MDRQSQAKVLIGSAVGGKYSLKRVLGIGGMGTVYEAVHAYTNRRVAVKILEAEFASSADATARFLQEAQAPSSIGHPNLVEVLDAGEDPQVGLYLVLEYLDGEDMESAVEHGRLELASLIEVTLQLLDALGAAHARGFVHRDIKPANIFLTRDQSGRLKVKLLDFGIARDVSRSLTVGNAVMGTPHYMSPEQAKGLRVDARADLWSVGAMLFHALAGVPPYDGPHPNVIMVKIIMQDAPSLATLRPDLSKTLLHVVDRALKRPVEARWDSAAQMATQLSAAPERLKPAVKITNTLRNRVGVVSEMRATGPSMTLEPELTPSPVKLAPMPPRHVGTGTLSDDEPPTADAATPPTTAPTPAAATPPATPPTPTAPVDAAPRPPRAIKVGAAALALTLGAVAIARWSSSPPPARVIAAPSTSTTARLDSPPLPVIAADVTLARDTAIEEPRAIEPARAEPERVEPERVGPARPHPRHVREPRAARPSRPSIPPQTAPDVPVRHIGGIAIGNYQTP